ncbi:ABC transporter substrate-binding protein [Marinactinospora thermotolerans]|uniref:Amino acid ABC transporter substrate-binding protein, PAAT family n=1 Tax=Marinactinospora thermotolerans DSM 45154 TaxID=1122192 RepID=A0A1T4SD85_9ACTN|nr:ABC transporter substrate-binding protein [Marinactinospora thermotolerans]SKA26234.1 amino acid ABC transporter substrate-binding protein, PAAT family [Marinactinospora thermotolerans DSM 45154]
MAVPKHLAESALAGRPFPIAALSLVSVLALSACGGGGEGGEASSPAPSVEADSELSAMVPQEIRDAGEITVGVDASYAPGQFLDTDGQTVIGFDVELFDAVAAKLGLETRWEPAPFGSIVTGVASGKYNAGVSSFTINAERLEQVHMVSYFNVGTQWFTQAGNPADVDPENACGKRIAVQKNTVQVPDIEARSQACVEAGDPEIVIEQFEGQDQATESIVSGKNDAALADMPVAVYAVEQTGDRLETLGEQYEAAPYGAVVNKEETELAEAIAAGYTAIIEDGTYTEILAKWGLEQGAIEQPEVDPEIEE